MSLSSHPIPSFYILTKEILYVFNGNQSLKTYGNGCKVLQRRKKWKNLYELKKTTKPIFFIYYIFILQQFFCLNIICTCKNYKHYIGKPFTDSLIIL